MPGYERNRAYQAVRAQAEPGHEGEQATYLAQDGNHTHVGLLERAGELARVLFTRDDDLLTKATKRQQAGIPFCGIVYAHQLRVSSGSEKQ